MISVPCDDRIEIPSSFAFERSQQSQGVADRSANTMSTGSTASGAPTK